MRIWIDGDAAPRDANEIVFRAARRLKLRTTLVANQHIVDHSEPGDLAITADIPLAAELVEKDVMVVDPRGEEYTRDNVRERLSIRHFMEDLRNVQEWRRAVRLPTAARKSRLSRAHWTGCSRGYRARGPDGRPAGLLG